MGDAGHHWVDLCPKPRWSWFGGCPRVEARRVSPTIDQNAYMYMYTLKYIIERGEERRVGSVGGYEVTFEYVLRKFTHLLEFTDLRTYVHSLLVMHVLL